MEFLNKYVPKKEFENVAIVIGEEGMAFGTNPKVLNLTVKEITKSFQSLAEMTEIINIIKSEKKNIFSKFPGKSIINVNEGHAIFEATPDELQIDKANSIYSDAYAQMQMAVPEKQVAPISESITDNDIKKHLLEIGKILIDNTWTTAEPKEKVEAKKALKVSGGWSHGKMQYTIETAKKFNSVWSVQINDESV